MNPSNMIVQLGYHSKIIANLRHQNATSCCYKSTNTSRYTYNYDTFINEGMEGEKQKPCPIPNLTNEINNKINKLIFKYHFKKINLGSAKAEGK